MNRINFLPPWVETNLQPAFYDVESGTVLQQVARMYAKVNQLVRNVNDQNDKIAEYVQQFIELKDYVETYFDNLNVQEEINNKLDAMAEDGTLLNLLTKYFVIDDTINFRTKFALPEYFGGSSYGMQGGCVMPDGNIIQCYGDGHIRKIAPDGLTLIEVTQDFGHCNSCTYCSKNNKIYIVNGSSVNQYKIFEVDPLTLTQTGVFDCESTFPSAPYGITYVEELDKFVFANWWNGSDEYIWTTDIEFNVLETKEYSFDILTTSNMCRFGEQYIGIDVLGSHKMLLFDYNTLDFVKECKINELVSNTWVITEQEWYDYRNGKQYIGFVASASTTPVWGAGTHVYGVCDLTQNYEETVSGQSFITPCNEKYYVDHTVTPALDRNGSSTKPFANIYEALNSALRMSDKRTGFVTIVMNNQSSDRKYGAIFTTGKTYSIEASNTFTSFYMVAVSENSSVRFNRAVTITPNTPKENPFNWGTGGDLNVMGTLTCVGSIKNADSSRLYLCGGDKGNVTFGVETPGLDVEHYWGKVTNNRCKLLASTDLVTNTHFAFSSEFNNTTISNLYMDIKPSNGTYVIPPYSNKGVIIPKFTLTISGNSVTVEQPIPYTMNLWSEIPFVDDNGKHTLIINSNGTVTIEGLTFARIRAVTE